MGWRVSKEVRCSVDAAEVNWGYVWEAVVKVKSNRWL
jgi:hypothetical protein